VVGAVYSSRQQDGSRNREGWTGLLAHREFWMELAALVRDGAAWSRARVQGESPDATGVGMGEGGAAGEGFEGRKRSHKRSKKAGKSGRRGKHSDQQEGLLAADTSTSGPNASTAAQAAQGSGGAAYRGDEWSAPAAGSLLSSGARETGVKVAL